MLGEQLPSVVDDVVLGAAAVYGQENVVSTMTVDEGTYTSFWNYTVPGVFQLLAGFPGYTFCYNRPLLAERVRDVLTVLAASLARPEIRSVRLVATGDAGASTRLPRRARASRLPPGTLPLLTGDPAANGRRTSKPQERSRLQSMKKMLA